MSTTPMNSTASHVEVELAPNNQIQIQPRQRSRKNYGNCSVSKRLSTAGIFLALLLVAGALYMHLKQKHHLGRLHIELAAKEHNVSEVKLPFQVVTVPAAAELGQPLLSQDCLECIAATATANKPAKCGSASCSVYRISWAYWQDTRRQIPSMDEDYESCVSNPNCATETVRSFVATYARDCDGDGKIRCRDHIMLHQLGPTGCLHNTLPALSQNRMSDCLRVKELE